MEEGEEGDDIRGRWMTIVPIKAEPKSNPVEAGVYMRHKGEWTGNH